MLAFHTDGDLPAARTARSNSVVLARAKALPTLGGLFGSGTWTQPTAGFCAAHGARLECPVGRDWIAVGDAALAFDPLASQGLFNALHTGLAGAEAAHRHLAGDSGALPSYAEELRQVSEVYDAHRAAWYGIERRWRDRPFWQRREQAAR
jgi:flavin-dependent dehydrogenase